MRKQTAFHTESGYLPTGDGGQLYYEIGGDGADVILIHAGIADSRMWDFQFTQLARHFRVTRYDLAGYGRSSRPATAYAHFEQLALLLDHLDVELAALVGASMGGVVAMECALANPETVDRLVLAGSGVGFTPWSPERTHRNAEIGLAFAGGDVRVANELEIQMWVDGPLRSSEMVNPAVRSAISAMNLELLESMPADDQEVGLEPPVVERLTELLVPTLLITGELDMPDVHDAAGLMLSRLPIVRQVIIPGVAHMPGMEAPEAFNQLVLDFLKS